LQEPAKGIFTHKKIVKVLREEFGMIFLLNLVKECEKKFKESKNAQTKVFNILLEVIKERKLISPEKLERILTEHETSMEKKRQSHQSNAHNNSNNSNEKA
jgi:hypothetical protein